MLYNDSIEVNTRFWFQKELPHEDIVEFIWLKWDVGTWPEDYQIVWLVS